CRSSAAGSRCGWRRSTKTSSSLGPPSSSCPDSWESHEPTTLALTPQPDRARLAPGPPEPPGTPSAVPPGRSTPARSRLRRTPATPPVASPTPPPRNTERKHPVKRNRLVATSVASTITLALALTACSTGGNDNGSGEGEAATGDIRVWLNGSDTPDAAREYLKTTFE